LSTNAKTLMLTSPVNWYTPAVSVGPPTMPIPRMLNPGLMNPGVGVSDCKDKNADVASVTASTHVISSL
jgi:hypothetical protein